MSTAGTYPARHDQCVHPTFPDFIISLSDADFHESLGFIKTDGRKIVARHLKNPALKPAIQRFGVKRAKNLSPQTLLTRRRMRRNRQQFRVISGDKRKTECDCLAFTKGEHRHRFRSRQPDREVVARPAIVERGRVQPGKLGCISDYCGPKRHCPAGLPEELIGGRIGVASGSRTLVQKKTWCS